jgi:hypothetical protein
LDKKAVAGTFATMVQDIVHLPALLPWTMALLAMVIASAALGKNALFVAVTWPSDTLSF